MLKFTAQTASGAKTGQIWMNKRDQKTSQLVHAGDVAEICGITDEELQAYDSLEDLNLDTLPFGSFAFSEEAEFSN